MIRKEIVPSSSASSSSSSHFLEPSSLSRSKYAISWPFLPGETQTCFLRDTFQTGQSEFGRGDRSWFPSSNPKYLELVPFLEENARYLGAGAPP